MYPANISIYEVGPRDGLQNELQVSIAAKVALIEQLARAGLKRIEAASFVSPKWVPQMAGAAELCQQLTHYEGVSYSALTPNLQGFEAAMTHQLDEVAVFTAASETFCRRNINCSISESLQRFEPVFAAARAQNIPIRAYVSCVLGCPYEGEIPTSQVAAVAHALIEMGAYEVSLGDTIGVGTPLKARHMLDNVCQQVAPERLALHFHDTYGQALANVLACLDSGIATLDASVAGLGGCPYAHGASGNLATEDLVYMLHGMGIHTGISLPLLMDAGDAICQQLGRLNGSKMARANGH